MRSAVYDDFAYDEFPDPFPQDFPEEAPSTGEEEPPHETEGPHVPMREQFPEPGTTYLGGTSNGWEYRTVFGGSKLAHTYDMVKQFLRDEGYGDVPIPATADELKRFRRPRNAQLQLFSERGYIHNPIKILFPEDAKQRNTLILCIYNELYPQHLLRFHGLVL